MIITTRNSSSGNIVFDAQYDNNDNYKEVRKFLYNSSKEKSIKDKNVLFYSNNKELNKKYRLYIISQESLDILFYYANHKTSLDKLLLLH